MVLAGLQSQKVRNLGYEFFEFIKSVLPDQFVAITALPIAIASARCKPNPSDLCSEISEFYEFIN